MRRLTILVPLAVAFAVTASEAAKPASKPAGAGKPTITKTSPSKGPTVKATSASGSKSVKPAKTTTQVAKGGGQAKVSGAKADKGVKPQGTQAKADAKATKADARATKAEARTAKSGSSTTTSTTDGTSTSPSSTTTTTTTSTPTTSTPTIDFTSTKVGKLLEKNPTLRSKIEAKLQAAGYTGTAFEAGYGFKNVGQLNAATNQVQNQGTSFNLLKVLMTGTYVDPVTHNVYRAQTLPNGTVQLVKPELATNTPSTLSLGQAKQSIAGGAVMPEIVPYTTTTSTTTTSTTTTSTTTSTSKTSTSPTATGGAASTTTGKSKPRKSYGNVPTGGSF